MALNTHTLSDVWTYAKRQFGDESAVQITEADITRATNQACMEIVSKNKVLRASAQIDSVLGQDEYDKPDDCLQLTSVKYGTTLLRGIGFDDFQNRFAQDDCDEVKYWTQYGDTLVLGAAPTEDATTIKIYYIPEPAPVGNPTDTLPVPDRYFDRVCEYVMSKLYELDEDWQGHQTNRQMFEDNLQQLSNDETNNRGPYSAIVPYDCY